MSAAASNFRKTALMVGALGVVFGDIGTSPLYAIKESFAEHMHIAPDTTNVLGVLSLVFWLLTIVVTLKYVTFILRADNKGEGGTLSLNALVLRTTNNFRMRRFFVVLALMGASLFFGDTLLTPAISVLSAVEGLEVAMPHISHLVIPLTIVILIALFSVQKNGTAMVGKFFGPIIFIWFVTIGTLGLFAIIANPVVLQALNPWYAVAFFLQHKFHTMIVLGAIVLAITGAETIYADIGHFGRKPIQRAWLYVALPGLLLNYFGQGAIILSNPISIENPFYYLAPDWFKLPLVLIATAATVIASQATISGTFSITRQAVQLGYLPRMTITHTSEQEAGQIYIPTVNWMVGIAVVMLVLAFKSSSNLANAYCLAITGMMVITTFLAYFVTRRLWGWKRWQSLAVCIPLFSIDLLLFSSNMLKVFEGGWFTLTVAGMMTVLMLTWIDGSRYLYKQISSATMPLREFIASLNWGTFARVPGTGIFLVRTTGDTPPALMRNFKYNHVMHEQVIILNMVTQDVPRVSRKERYTITDLGHNFSLVEARYGFMELPSIPLLLRQCVEEGRLELDMGSTNFFVSRITIIPDPNLGLSLWRDIIYKILHINSARVHDFYRIPTNKVLEIGMQIRM